MGGDWIKQKSTFTVILAVNRTETKHLKTVAKVSSELFLSSLNLHFLTGFGSEFTGVQLPKVQASS